MPYEGLAGQGGQDGPVEHIDEEPALDDLAFVQFTSGATSEPKGVALTHRNLCENINAINGPHGLETTDADSAVSWLPLHHDMGLVGMALGPLYAVRPAAFLPAKAFVRRPAEWLRAISRHGATVSFAPNFAYDLCVRRVKESDLDGVDLSSLAGGGLRGRADSRADARGLRRPLSRLRVSRDELPARLRARRTRRGRDVCSARQAGSHRWRARQLRHAFARPSSANRGRAGRRFARTRSR